MGNDVILRHQVALQRDIGSYGVTMQVLNNGVTPEDVIREISTGLYPVVIFMTHTFAQGVSLSHGQFMEPDALAAVANFGVELVYLLSCESVAAGRMLQESAGVNVICTLAPLDSGDAYRTGSLFMRALAAGESYEQAYRMSKPGNNAEFLFLTGDRQLGAHKMTDDERRQLADHERLLREYGGVLSSLKAELIVIKNSLVFTVPKMAVILWVAVILMSAGFVILLVWLLGSLTR